MTDTTIETIECPFCCEPVSPRAKKCRHCGETLDLAMRKAEEAMRSSEKQGNVYMNAGGAAAVAGGHTQQLRPFSHLLHFILTLITAGLWLPVWILLYIFRNKNVYF